MKRFKKISLIGSLVLYLSVCTYLHLGSAGYFQTEIKLTDKNQFIANLVLENGYTFLSDSPGDYVKKYSAFLIKHVAVADTVIRNVRFENGNYYLIASSHSKDYEKILLKLKIKSSEVNRIRSAKYFNSLLVFNINTVNTISYRKWIEDIDGGDIWSGTGDDILIEGDLLEITSVKGYPAGKNKLS